MSRVPLVFIALMASYVHAATASDRAMEELKLKGPEFVLEKYFSCESESAYAHIEAGDTSWIKIGIQVIPYTQGCQTEDLYFSLASALPKAPETILPLVSEVNGYSMCLPPYVREDSRESWTRYLNRLEKVLKRVKAKDLLDQRNVCLEKIKEMRGQLAEIYQ